MTDYFKLFGLDKSFDLDSDALNTRYRAMAAQFHPDRTASASAFEQKQAVMMAAAVNEAYRVLANPLERAAWLLLQQGIDADAPEHTHFAAEFLMQQMEWREALMDAKMADNEAALQRLDAEIAGEQMRLHAELSAQFAQTDYDTAAETLRRGRFLHKLRTEIAAALP